MNCACVYIGYNSITLSFMFPFLGLKQRNVMLAQSRCTGLQVDLEIGLVFPERTTELFSVSLYVYLGLPSTHTQASHP